MFRVVLRVIEPRWDGKSKKYQEPGTLIEIKEENLAAFRRQILLHKAKCRLHEGEMPKMGLKLKEDSKKKTMVVKTGEYEGQSFSTFREFSNDKTDEKVKQEVSAIDSLTCPVCNATFKTSGGLARHMKRHEEG